MDANQIQNLFASNVRQLLVDADLDYDKLYEIRLRVGRPLFLTYDGGECFLRQKDTEPYLVTREDLKETLEYVSGYSLYAYEDEIRQGFLSVQGGHRVGVTGKVILDGEDIYDKRVDTTLLRKKVGMVFQQPNPFPMSIYDNIAYGPRLHGIKNKKELDEIVERSLQGAAIFEEVKDRLHKSALGLSGGQQQRLCIARALAVSPEVLLMDEPTSALDPISTLKIEELMETLKKKYTVVIVTHNMQQAARVSDDTAFFLVGEVVEKNATSEIFARPRDKRTEDYITGRFG